MNFLIAVLTPLFALFSDRYSSDRVDSGAGSMQSVQVPGRLFATASNGVRFLLLDSAEELARLSAWVGPVPRGAIHGSPRILAAVDTQGRFVFALMGEVDPRSKVFWMSGFLQQAVGSPQPRSETREAEDALRDLETRGILLYHHAESRRYAIEELSR